MAFDTIVSRESFHALANLVARLLPREGACDPVVQPTIELLDDLNGNIGRDQELGASVWDNYDLALIRNNDETADFHRESFNSFPSAIYCYGRADSSSE
jgi:hypothetical protein